MAINQTPDHDSTRSLNKLIMPFALATTAAIGSIVLGRTLEDYVDRTNPKPAVSSEPTTEEVAKEGGSVVVGTLGADMLAPKTDINLDHKFGPTPLQHSEDNTASTVGPDSSTGNSVGQPEPHLPAARL